MGNLSSLLEKKLMVSGGKFSVTNIFSHNFCYMGKILFFMLCILIRYKNYRKNKDSSMLQK